jgi:hypothetical protein
LAAEFKLGGGIEFQQPPSPPPPLNELPSHYNCARSLLLLLLLQMGKLGQSIRHIYTAHERIS